MCVVMALEYYSAALYTKPYDRECKWQLHLNHNLIMAGSGLEPNGMARGHVTSVTGDLVSVWLCYMLLIAFRTLVSRNT
jgi:hypothetical protein